MTKQCVNKDDVLAHIHQAKWYHSFEIVPGVITPGICRVYPEKMFQRFGLASRLNGKRILEIGTWDGPFAFELEFRGAEVVATDIQDPDRTGFNTAKTILGSQLKYVRASVYDLTQHLDGKFDIVVFMGVFYHLKYPVLAFEEINKVLKDDGILLFEGECFSHYAEKADAGGVKRLSRLLLSVFAHSEIPMALFYSGTYKNDISNWHIPNISCVKSWLATAHFHVKRLQIDVGERWFDLSDRQKQKLSYWEIFRHLLFRNNNNQRILGTAVKMDGETLIEHGLV